MRESSSQFGSVWHWVYVVGSVLLLIAGGARAQGQPELAVESYLSSVGDARIVVGPPDLPVLSQVDRHELESSTYATAVGLKTFQIYWRYDESQLMAGSNRVCYLGYYLRNLRQALTPDGKADVWFQKQQIKAEGDFLDGKFPLKVSVTADGRTETGTLEIVAHREYPGGALVPSTEPLELTIQTNDAKPTTLNLQNMSGCAVLLGSQVGVDADDNIWGQDGVKAVVAVQRLPATEKHEPRGAVKLTLRPRTSQAFLRTFLPAFMGKPDTKVGLTIPYTVDNGGAAETVQTINVKFKPAMPLVLLCVVLGSVISSVLSLFVSARVPETKRAILGAHASLLRQVWEGVKRVLLAVGVSGAVFLIYYVAKGDKAVVFFNFPFDPTQLLPAAIIGFLVGMRPLFWWGLIERAAERWGSQPKSAAGTKAVVLLAGLTLTLFFVGAAADAGVEPRLRAVSVSYDQASDTLFCLDGPSNLLFRVQVGVTPHRLEVVGPIHIEGMALDHCVVRNQSGAWLAIVTGTRGWRGSPGQRVGARHALLLTPLPGGRTVGSGPLARELSGFVGPLSVAYDPGTGKILVADAGAAAIVAIPVSAGRLGAEEILVRYRGLRAPESIAATRNLVIVGDTGGVAFQRLENPQDQFVTVIRDVGDPRAVVIAPNGRAFAVADTARAAVLLCTLPSGAIERKIGYKELREPNGVAIDSHGHVWVSDRWLQELLEFAPDGRPLARYRP
jgi:hypothetical protein